MGASGLVEGKKIAVGAQRYMVSLGLDVSAFARESARLAGEGKTPLFAAVDGRLAAIAERRRRDQADKRRCDQRACMTLASRPR